MKVLIASDFKNIKKLSKDFFNKIKLVKNDFDRECIEILEDRAKANCPDSNEIEKDVKGSITILYKKDKSGVFESGVGTDGNKEALKLHEAPRDKKSTDKNTKEGGQGNKFLSRVADFHFSTTFPKLIVSKNKKKGLI